MRRFLIIACIALLWAFGSAVPAATPGEVTVRSGDHDGFSRLVLALPHRVDWRITGTGRDRKVIVKDRAWRFDLSTVFVRMRDDRLRNIAPTPGGLRLTLGCECAIETFWHGQSMLVIDIRDPDIIADGAGAQKTRPSPSPEKVVPIQADRGPAHLLTAGRIAAELAAASLAQDLFGMAPAPSPPGVPPKPDLSIAREQLARQISRATTMGLLSPQVDISPGGTEAEPPPGANDGADPVRTPAPEPDAGPGLQLRSEMSLDHEVIAPSDTLQVTYKGKVCLGDDALAIAQWGDGGSFATRIGPARARLTDELGRFDGAAALDLARLYLHHGFGVEARQVLHVAGVEGRKVQVARAIADIFQHGEAEGSSLAGQLSCASGAAMWSALSYRALPPGAPLDLDAILRGVNALPRHLRDLLAPNLARKLMAAGRAEAADDVLRQLERGGAAPAPGQGLARAEVELAAGDDAAADETLGRIVESNVEIAAEALLRRIDARLASGRAIPQDMADLAGAYAHELRDAEIGPDLARAYIEASAASGAFKNAFDHRARLDAELPEATRRHVTDTLFDLLTRNAEDVTFLTYALSMQPEIDGRLSAETETAIARRLLDTGFPVAAQAYLDGAAQGPAQRERRLLRAKAARALGTPRQALVELLGLSGPDANRLRADARSMAGEFNAARELYATGGQPDSALRAAMQAEDWELASALGDAEIARLASGSGAPEALSDGNLLAHDRALIDASATTRSLVGNLLGARQIPGEPDEGE
ncbi:hypothetical protein D6850_16175 [Roseovarius spongiae]|uniref:HEAT repeat domain-containing protein n=1 Tax=Roseovarius spongiae TaxID=2320272 RepID=A0A3A8B7W7_9RHOB|nr:hypothetical protein [Roseovarius spongiae]RKF13037.1 hypothetical protein D6850_16175 [Roseovarius spongiae]